MGVAAWGYGTGATTADAHPFSLTIQGIDVIDWVPLESIKVTTTISSNGTLDFEIVGNPKLPNLPIRPFAYADVVLTEHIGSATVPGAFDDGAFQTDAFASGEATAARPPLIIFSGIIVGTAEVGLAAGEAHRVKCVDYGYLLDVCPMKGGILVTYPTGVVPPPGSFATQLYEPVLSLMGQAATPGITACATDINGYTPGDGRVLDKRWPRPSTGYTLGYVYDDVGEGDAFTAGNIRSNLDTVAERARGGEISVALAEYFETAPIAVYVDPERRLNVHPSNVTWADAPFTINNDAAGAGYTRTEYLELEYDYTSLSSGVFVNDTDTTVGGDNSAFFVGDKTTTNGYYICPDGTDAQLASRADVPAAGQRYMSNAGHEIVAGSLIVTAAQQLKIATAIAVTDSRFDLSGDEVVITEVSTEFYPGTSGSRRMDVKFVPVASYGTVGTGSAERTTRRRVTAASTMWQVPTTI